ncbi:MAG: hypothetical protein WHS46_10170 [Desulfosoma sp.]
MSGTAGAHGGPGWRGSGASEPAASFRLDTLRAELKGLSSGTTSLRQRVEEIKAPDARAASALGSDASPSGLLR